MQWELNEEHKWAFGWINLRLPWKCGGGGGVSFDVGFACDEFERLHFVLLCRTFGKFLSVRLDALSIVLR